MTLLDVCRVEGARLDACGIHGHGTPIEGVRLLWALAGCESTFGALREFVRDEPSYRPGGAYYRRHMPALWKRWGVLSASSFGSFQMLYVTAWELGFRGHPIELQDDVLCAWWAATYVLDRIVHDRAGVTLSQIFDAYNTGTYHDRIVPDRYIHRGLEFYRKGLPS